MCGCDSDAAARASRSKRAGSAVSASTLTATRRPSSSSSASQTELIAPRPSGCSRRYRPAITVSAMRAEVWSLTVNDLLTIDDALRLILERVQPLDAEDVAIEEAAGRVLAEPARAAVDLPPFPSSAMDGYALRAADTPGTLPVAARIAAGRPAPRALAAGEAMAIATGGVVPDGADSVVPVEVVEERNGLVVVPGNVAHADNVRARGGDLRAGDAVVEAGVRLGPAHVGALA